MSHIKIIKQEPNDDVIEVSGQFTEFPDWTFDADILPEIERFDSEKYWSIFFDRIEGNDCWLCDFGRVISVTLKHKNEPYYTCPNDDYDNNYIKLDKIHQRMGRLVDQAFPPTREERERQRVMCNAKIDDTTDRLFSLIEGQPDLRALPVGFVRRALSRLADTYESRFVAF